MRQTLARRRELFNEDNADHRWDQSDPFREDFYLVPHPEEVWARSEQLAADNQDHFRHFVELAIWRAMDLDDRDHLKVLLSLLWLWEDVDPRRLAEASYRSVGDVRDLVDSEPVMTFNCLYCRVELKPMNWQHQVRMRQSDKAYRRDGGDPPTDLLCKTCSAHRAAHAEDQRRLDDLRQQAILAEYRGKPYAERRQSKEWAILKRQVHRRDGYRCRLCGRDDVELHIHHCTYDNYAEERLEDLITLCAVCHGDFHFRSEAS
jgi:5-methylcytosine-specific restriction endonuclease McrA